MIERMLRKHVWGRLLTKPSNRKRSTNRGTCGWHLSAEDGGGGGGGAIEVLFDGGWCDTAGGTCLLEEEVRSTAPNRVEDEEEGGNLGRTWRFGFCAS